MSTRHLNIFKAVYEKMNMTMAAESLYISQPSVSQAIKELENAYEVRLFERYPKKLYPTAEGDLFYQYVVQILGLYDELKNEIQYMSGNAVISVGANISAGTALMSKYIRKFNEKYPDVKIHVKVTGSSKLKDMIRDHRIDFALMEDILNETNLIQEPFYHDRIVLVCSPENIYAAKKKIKFRDLANCDFLLREKGVGVRDKFDQIMLMQGIDIDPVWESSNNRALINAVKNNYGIATMPYLLVQNELESGELKELDMDEDMLKRNLNIVYYKGKIFNKWTQAFIDIIKQEYKEKEFLNNSGDAK